MFRCALLAIFLVSCPYAQKLRLDSLSVGAFKSGVAYYSGLYTVPTNGVYELDIPPTSHGTFLIGSDDTNVVVTTSVVQREVNTTLSASDTNRASLQSTLAGKTVELRLKGQSSVVVKGTVLSQKTKNEEKSSSLGDFLVIENQDGSVTMVDASEISTISTIGKSQLQGKKKEKVMTASFTGVTQPRSVRIDYLAKGLIWAPIYHIMISPNSNSLSLIFEAQLRNENSDLEAKNFSLITGAPQLEFKDASSLLQSDIEEFSSSLGQNVNYGSGPSIMTQSAMYNTAASFGFSNNAPTVGADFVSDVAYFPIGSVSLPKDTSKSITVKTGSASFTRLVEWDINAEETYDSLQFRNPLPFAMTTAPVTIVDGFQLKGQSSCKWTPVGGNVLARMNKALSVLTKRTEVTKEGSSQSVNTAQKAPIKSEYVVKRADGTLIITNQRPTGVTVQAKLKINGIFKDASYAESFGGLYDKRTTEVEQSVGINPSSTVTWEIWVEKGATKSINYTYSFQEEAYQGYQGR